MAITTVHTFYTFFFFFPQGNVGLRSEVMTDAQGTSDLERGKCWLPILKLSTRYRIF